MWQINENKFWISIKTKFFNNVQTLSWIYPKNKKNNYFNESIWVEIVI